MKTLEEMKSDVLKRAGNRITFRARRKRFLRVIIIGGSLVIIGVVAGVITGQDIYAYIGLGILVGLLVIAQFTMPFSEWLIKSFKINDSELNVEYKKIILKEIERIPKRRYEIDDELIALRQSFNAETEKLKLEFTNLGEIYETICELKESI